MNLDCSVDPAVKKLYEGFTREAPGFIFSCNEGICGNIYVDAKCRAQLRYERTGVIEKFEIELVWKYNNIQKLQLLLLHTFFSECRHLFDVNSKLDNH